MTMKAIINMQTIENKLKEVITGRFLVETMKVLRESIFISSLLYVS